jgi:hypothetical protein
MLPLAVTQYFKYVSFAPDAKVKEQEAVGDSAEAACGGLARAEPIRRQQELRDCGT